ncbi:MAG: hypothetical protein ACXVHB_32985 [Solirubrobacteraceae bacterium]
MRREVGWLAIGASAVGYPLTEVVLQRGRKRGAIVVGSVCVGLAFRDASMVAGSSPKRLQRIPAWLLYLELVAAVVASLAASRSLLIEQGLETPEPDAVEIARRGAVCALFCLHTVRLHIYLSPDQGRRP